MSAVHGGTLINQQLADEIQRQQRAKAAQAAEARAKSAASGSLPGPVVQAPPSVKGYTKSPPPQRAQQPKAAVHLPPPANAIPAIALVNSAGYKSFEVPQQAARSERVQQLIKMRAGLAERMLAPIELIDEWTLTNKLIEEETAKE